MKNITNGIDSLKRMKAYNMP